MSTIDIVIPVYNEEGCIDELYSQLEVNCANCHDCEFRYILVDDGSKDNTLQKMYNLANKDHKVVVVELARNFGKEIATTAGIMHTNSDAVIIMDADLQHPPSYIPEFIEKWREGLDLVSSKRKKIEKREFLKKMGSHLYYRLINSISSVDMTSQTTDFRLLDRSVISYFKSFQEKNRMVRGLIDWMGFKKGYVEFTAPPRFAGNASYSYSKLCQLAINSIVSFSTVPLKVIVFLGSIVMLTSILLLGIVIIDSLFFNAFSFTLQAVFLLILTFMGGMILSAIGLVSYYISIIHEEVLGRPMYMTRQVIIKGEAFCYEHPNPVPNMIKKKQASLADKH